MNSDFHDVGMSLSSGSSLTPTYSLWRSEWAAFSSFITTRSLLRSLVVVELLHESHVIIGEFKISTDIRFETKMAKLDENTPTSWVDKDASRKTSQRNEQLTCESGCRKCCGCVLCGAKSNDCSLTTTKTSSGIGRTREPANNVSGSDHAYLHSRNKKCSVEEGYEGKAYLAKRSGSMLRMPTTKGRTGFKGLKTDREDRESYW